ncbi:MAG: hypothetical protein ACON4Z_08330 [Planctomycetota bacterium]
MRTFGAARAAALLAGLGLASGCATGDSATPSPELSLVCEQPMTVLEFLQFAQRRTGRIYVLRADVAPEARISWVGTLRCREDEFEQFVQTMLHVKGLALQRRQHGETELLEVVSLRPR